MSDFSRLVVVDTGVLAYRGLLSFGKDTPSSKLYEQAMFGFLSGVIELTEKFRPCRFAFCFDHGRNKRLDLFPEYKQEREKKAKTDPDYAARRRAVHDALETMKTDILPAAGYKNILYQDGYESDDIIAAVCVGCKKHYGDVVIVSEDQDFYQLLGEPVRMWMPRKRAMYTWRDYRAEYGIKASEWAEVKAVGGCRTDGVPGATGVSEAGAVAYVKGEATLHTRKRVLFQKDKVALARRLVTLPFEGCAGITPNQIMEDRMCPKAWRLACVRNGLPFLAGRPPASGKSRMGV